MQGRHQKKILEDIIFSDPSCDFFFESQMYLICILPALSSQTLIDTKVLQCKFDSTKQCICFY